VLPQIALDPRQFGDQEFLRVQVLVVQVLRQRIELVAASLEEVSHQLSLRLQQDRTMVPMASTILMVLSLIRSGDAVVDLPTLQSVAMEATALQGPVEVVAEVV
jgi:hypothetical protein